MLFILKEGSVVCVVIKIMDVELLKETGWVKQLIKVNRVFKVNHFINGDSIVNFILFLVDTFHFTYYDSKSVERIPRRFIDPSNKKT